MKLQRLRFMLLVLLAGLTLSLLGIAQDLTPMPLDIAHENPDLHATAMPGTLTGQWRGSLSFQGPPTELLRFDSTLSGLYMVHGYRFGAAARIFRSELRAVTLTASAPIGEAIRMDTTLQFDPRVPSFQNWRVVSRLRLWELDFTHTFFLASVPARSFMEISARGALEGITFTNTTRFAIFPLQFTYNTLTLRGTVEPWALAAEGRIRFDEHGFEHAAYILRDLPLPWPSSDQIQVYMDIETLFTESDKKVSPSLHMRASWDCCVRGYLALPEGQDGVSIAGLELQGFEVRLALAGGVELRSATSFVEAQNAFITGVSEFFEVWSVAGPIQPCCATPPGRWRVSTYYKENDELFGWSMTRFLVELPVSTVLRLSNQLSVRPATVPWEWEWVMGWTMRF